ncbi:ABC transporter substrate-binding protein [Streptomyces mirabilis]|uniref:ABC transporter substrate-binding protein n=1 Tax=Streptomyces mirabilis TaxID=68239 RepID=UPI0036A2C554
MRVDADGDLAPDLAESWEPDAQARTWTFRTREGVTFHDGRRLTAADAAYTLRHGSISGARTAAWGEAVRTPDEHTLVVPPKTPNAEFPRLVTHYNC